MLKYLDVRNLGIIDHVEMTLPSGFVALTGETGAGKSLLVESMNLLSGQRAQTDLVRTGAERLRVEAEFELEPGRALRPLLEELGIPCDGVLRLRREHATNGRGRAWVNDVTVTAGTLQRLAPFLLAIHGQHEQYGLADPGMQRLLVDRFGSHKELLERTRSAFDAWSAAAAEVDQLRSSRDRRRDRLDVITFQMAEIDALDPKPDEDRELDRQRTILRHAVRLIDLSSGLLGGLSEDEDSVLDRLAGAERATAEMAECGLEVEDIASGLGEARVLVEDALRSVQDIAEHIDNNPGELEDVESRLHRLEQLMLKYGSPLSAVLEHRTELAVEKRRMATVEEDLEAAVAAAATALDTYATAAEDLDQARHGAGAEMVAEVAAVLEGLAMSGTRLEFRWEGVPAPASPLERHGSPVAFTRDGVDECVLFFAANPGEDLRPMARVASGGELSRLHLGLQTVLRRRSDSTPRALLFDEVDSGLGGATAAALASLLADLAGHDQVLAVTHLPQVAARAAGHFCVSKTEQDGRAVTRVALLDRDARESEVARMVAGEEVTDAAREHARGLLEDTRQ